MIKDLTAREKTMLYVLALFVLAFACLYFLIMPTIAETARLRDAVEITRETAQSMRAVIDSAGKYEEQIAALEQQLGALSARQAPLMSNSALDALVTGIITSCGMTPHSLTLSRPHEQAVYSFDDTSQAEPAGIIMQNTASAVFSGSLSGFARFLSAVEQIDTARVTYVGYDIPGSEDSYTFTVGLVVYMGGE